MREKIASNARDKSQLENAEKQPEIMDVSQRAVEQIMELYDIRTMVHGHTHRPAIHQFKLGNANATRIVLGDWYEQGSMLRWNANGYQLEQLTF
jgi:UDP-2,3-diacylglucosamine hydrolase